MTQAYPLKWPPAWQRQQQPVYSNFKTSLAKARDGLLRQLDLLGATNVVISSNMTLTKDGLPYYRQPAIDDTGIAVYFTLDGDEQCFPCDEYVLLQDNLHAIELTIEALRGIERWGAGQMMHAAFSGFKAIPATSTIVAPSGPALTWYEVLGVAPTASKDLIKSAYRILAKTRHPDAGGTAADWAELNRAYQESGVA